MGNKNIKNKIITISGEPVSGKGTNVKRLIEKLKEQGYSEQQIHLFSTGGEFRRYFNSIVDFVKNIDNAEKVKEIASTKELTFFLGKPEYRELLLKTIAKLKKQNVNLSKFTIEQANNSDHFHDIRHVVDSLIDDGMKNLGKELNREEHPNDIWIIDSRLAFANIPESFSVRLTTVPRIAGERLFNDKSRGEEDNKYETVEDAIREREERRIGERERYIKRYNIDLEDEDNYDLIIDTSYSSVEDISDTILKCFNCHYKDKDFGKKWASPKTLLPLQHATKTLETTLFGGTMEELEEEIKEYGYYPDSLIEVITVDNINYIFAGHHRNFAMAHAGKTLVPYRIIAKDNEKIPRIHYTARRMSETIEVDYLYSHESIINEDFSYNDIYPDIYEKIKLKQDNER